MATSTYANYVIVDEQFQGGFIETLAQNVSAFNAASAGAITLNTRSLLGHYEKEAMWDEVSAIARRDISKQSSDTVTATALTQDEFISVKLNRRNGPYEVNIDAQRKKGFDPRGFSRVIGQQTAVAVPKEMIDRGLAACEAKLDSIAALEYDNTASTITNAAMINGLKKAGDSAGGVVLWVMHSAQYFDLMAAQFASTATIWGSTDIGATLYEANPYTLNRPTLVIDSTSLVETGGVSSAQDKYSILGLRKGAIQVDISEPPIAVMEGPLTGSENLFFRWQAEYAYNLGLLGCQWDTTNGGVNPTNTNVATATNWDTVVADNKLLPGVIVTTR